MIDRDEVLTWLTICGENSDCSGCCPYHAENNHEGSIECMSALMRDALELLKEQPEQKHGHWKGFTQSRYFGTDDDGEPIFRDGLFYVCSECRLRSIIKHPYCPRCGAKMDGEAKQDD